MGVIGGGIGFFDSGVGGLSVLRECLPVTGELPVYYYGDNARAPYGNRDIYEIRAYAHDAFRVFERLGVVAVVIACNTVTALLLEELQSAYPFPVIGIEPAILSALQNYTRIAVLATKATVASDRFQALLQRSLRKYPSSKVQVFGCASLAGGVERMAKGEHFDIPSALPKADVDAVVLGCTHYSLIAEKIAFFYGAEAFDGNANVVTSLKEFLKAGEQSYQNVNFQSCRKAFFRKLSSVTFRRGKKSDKFRLSSGRKSGDLKKVKSVKTLYFIGSGRSLNCQFYEHMFEFKKVGGKSG